MNRKSFKVDVSCHEMSSSISSQSCQHILLQSSFFSSCFHSNGLHGHALLFKRLLLKKKNLSELSVSIQPFHLSLPATQERQQLWSQDKPQQNLWLFNKTEERKINFLCHSRCCNLKCAQLSSGFESSVPNTKIYPCNCCRKAQLPNWLFSHNCHLLGEALLWSCTAAAFKMATTFHHFILLSVDLCDVIPVRALVCKI